MLKKISLFVSLIVLSSSVFAWQVRQTKINHVQVGNADYFYMTVEGDVSSVSGCENMSTGKQWVGFSVNDMTEKKKFLISLALTAYTSGKLVDVGSTTSGCNSAGIAELEFIRIGDYLK